MPPEEMQDWDDLTPPESLDDRLKREEPPVEADDTSPSRPLNPTDEPPVSADDTAPRAAVSLEDQLHAEEPPASDDDTNPHQAVRLDDRLRDEEPPVRAEDTNPSLASQEIPALVRAGESASANGVQRVLAIVMLIGALALTAAAALIWLSGDEETPAPAPDTRAEVSGKPATVTPQPTATQASSTSQPAAADSGAPAANPVAMPLFPTAAAEEIAAALLTPAPGARVARAIQRENNPFTIRPAESRASVVQYTVQQGDTLESIASKFHLNDFYTLIWSNENSKVNPLRPGNTINIPPEDGVFFEVDENITIGDLAERYSVDPYTIIDADYNNLDGSSPGTVLVAGMGRIGIPGGEAERMNLLAAATGSTGSGGGGMITGPYNLWGCNSNISGGTLPVSRPLQGGYTWMQGFSLGGHEGVDLSPTMGIGEPVHAAGSGTVAYAGWNSYGYGNVVVIGHGAYFTLYGHLNSYSVSCGASVSAGQVIGTVGNTGNSTGPHLHFEVRNADWIARNPQDFVGF